MWKMLEMQEMGLGSIHRNSVKGKTKKRNWGWGQKKKKRALEK